LIIETVLAKVNARRGQGVALELSDFTSTVVPILTNQVHILFCLSALCGFSYMLAYCVAVNMLGNMYVCETMYVRETIRKRSASTRSAGTHRNEET
jgi:hypothetical protein